VDVDACERLMVGYVRSRLWAGLRSRRRELWCWGLRERNDRRRGHNDNWYSERRVSNGTSDREYARRTGGHGHTLRWLTLAITWFIRRSFLVDALLGEPGRRL